MERVFEICTGETCKSGIAQAYSCCVGQQPWVGTFNKQPGAAGAVGMCMLTSSPTPQLLGTLTPSIPAPVIDWFYD